MELLSGRLTRLAVPLTEIVELGNKNSSKAVGTILSMDPHLALVLWNHTTVKSRGRAIAAPPFKNHYLRFGS